jgi:hypothetical protein
MRHAELPRTCERGLCAGEKVKREVRIWLQTERSSCYRLKVKIVQMTADNRNIQANTMQLLCVLDKNSFSLVSNLRLREALCDAGKGIDR